MVLQILIQRAAFMTAPYSPGNLGWCWLSSDVPRRAVVTATALSEALNYVTSKASDGTVHGDHPVTWTLGQKYMSRSTPSRVAELSC